MYSDLDSYKNYECSIENVRNQIESIGIAVVQVFQASDCSEFRSRAWADMKRLINMSPDDPKSYPNLNKVSEPGSMIIRHIPLGHLQWVWDIRQDPRVAEVFAAIWGVASEDLITSFDSLSILAPPEITGSGWFDGKLKIHTDQSRQTNEICSVQGLLNLYPVNPGDATLFVLEGSQKFHFEYIDSKKNDDKEKINILNDEEVERFIKNGCEPRRILANEGTIVLWDSRVFHAASKPIRERLNTNFRLVAYICMMPRQSADEQTLKKRLKAIQEKRLSNHWANAPAFLKSFKNKNNLPFRFTDIGQPRFTPLGRRIAGYN